MEAQGNEFSYFMLMAGSFILNHSVVTGQWTVHPWMHSNLNHLTDEDQARGGSGGWAFWGWGRAVGGIWGGAGGRVCSGSGFSTRACKRGSGLERNCGSGLAAAKPPHLPTHRSCGP